MGRQRAALGEKAHDKWTTPLCHYHHQSGTLAQHRIGEEAFWREVHGIDPFAIAERLWIESGGADRAALRKPAKRPKLVKARKPKAERVKVAKSRRTIPGHKFNGEATFKAEAAAVASQAAAPAYQSNGISFGELQERKASEPNQCRYPIGDVGPGLLFCGSETLPGESYCGHCHEICYPKNRQPAALSQAQRERRVQQGKAIGFANVRKGRTYGHQSMHRMVPVVNGEAIV